MGTKATFKDASRMIEEAIEAEISLLSQCRLNNPSSSGFVLSSDAALTTQDTSFALPDVIPIGSLSYPHQIKALMEKKRAHLIVGLFTSLFRSWFAIDNTFALWDYRPNGNYCIFEDIPDVIVSVGFPVSPQKDIFQPNISYILPIATSTMIILLGVVVADAEAKTVQIVNLGYCVEAPTIMTKVVCCEANRRIFCSGVDGNIYEVIYHQGGSPFLPHINLASYSCALSSNPLIGPISSIISSAKKVLGLTNRKSIRDLVVTKAGDFVISLDDASSLTAWRLTPNALEQTTVLPHRFQSGSGNVGESNPLVRIFIIDSDQEDCNLVAIALNGEQFRYRYGSLYGSGVDLAFKTHVPSLIPLDRVMSISNGFGDTVFIAHRSPTDAEGCEQVVTFRAATHAVRPHNRFRDVVTTFDNINPILGSVEAVEASSISLCCSGDAISATEIRYQVLSRPRRVIFAHSNGLSLYMICRPVDVLLMILSTDSAVKDNLIKRFSDTFSPPDYATMLLQIAMGVGFDSSSDYSLFESSGFSLLRHGGGNNSAMELFGCQLRTEVDLKIRNLAKSLLLVISAPSLKEAAPSFGQKAVTVDLSPFAGGVLAFTTRALITTWCTPVAKTSVLSFAYLKNVLSKFICFLGSLDIGQKNFDVLQIPFPVHWRRNRIMVSLPQNQSLTIVDANRLQFGLLQCCVDLMLRVLQAVHLLQQWTAIPQLVGDHLVTLRQLLDPVKAQQLGERLSRNIMQGVFVSEGDPVKAVGALKGDCPFFFSTVDISEYQFRCEMKSLEKGVTSGALNTSRCREWGARVAPCAAQMWRAGSLSLLCKELASHKQWETAVKLLLHAARQLDPENECFSVYLAERRNGEPTVRKADPVANGVYEEKIKILQATTDILENAWFTDRNVLDSLFGSARRPGCLWTFEPSDEMAHFFLMDWLSFPRKNNETEKMLKSMLVASSSSHLGKYFSHNKARFGAEYSHYLCSSRKSSQEGAQQGLTWAQSPLLDIPLEQRLNYRLHCFYEALENARDAGMEAAQLSVLENRLKLLEVQKLLLKIISDFKSSPRFVPQREWRRTDGSTATESDLVAEHHQIAAGGVMGAAELLRVAGMYPLYGGAELQLDVLSCSNVYDKQTFVLCVAQAYEREGSTVRETSQRLLEKYYQSCFSYFPLTYIIRMLEANEYMCSPQGSTQTVDILLQSKVDSIVAYHSYRSIVEGADDVGLSCPHFERANVSKAFLIHSLAYAAVVMLKAGRGTPTLGCGKIIDDVSQLIHETFEEAGVSAADQRVLERASFLLRAFHEN